ncbi:hypothetical protein G6F37_012786 [Rhizopus arrhizus]|nr:hypothetical protein G6F38_012578 [Rhizopus arrhizus]KAG1141619.1 hypothetical protein G6F37_012786 [Rhizopus arrhizus]
MSSIEQQLAAMQEQMATLQAQLAQVVNPTPMQSVEDAAPATLHSLSTRPHYEWTPSETQINIMNMDVPIHTSKPMATADRKAIIEAYPPVAQLEYRSPATIPSAEKNMNKGQKIEDNSLKHLQYQASAILRPLDVLAHEMLAQDPNTPHLERFCTMLADARSLVIDLCSTITQTRLNIAYRSVDPSFSVKTESEVGYIVPLEEFQQSISQQAAAKKAIREASALRRPRRRFPNGTPNPVSFSNGSNQQFFRPGPPSQQGGFSNNNNINSSNKYTNNYTSNANNSNNNFQQRSHKKNTNPFRQ